MKQLALRPHDVAVALQLVISPQQTYAKLGEAIGMSASEVHEAVRRLRAAKLLSASAFREVRRRNLEEFLVAGVPYAFPVELGPVTRGVPTAHSAPRLGAHLQPRAADTPAEDVLVWPHEDGTMRGVSLTPLYRAAPATAKRNPELYELLTLVDALRIGRARERQLAKMLLRQALHVELA